MLKRNTNENKCLGLELLRNIFSTILTDDAELIHNDDNRHFWVEIRNYLLSFNIDYINNDFKVKYPLKIRKEDVDFFNYLERLLLKFNIYKV